MGSAPWLGSWAEIAPGQTVTHRFDTNGTYVYYCMLHIGMVGAIVVGDGSGAGLSMSAGAYPSGDVATGAAFALTTSARTTNADATGSSTGVKIALALVGTTVLASVAGVIRYARAARVRNRNAAEVAS